ncbi:hypothetical protein BC830DRAFT_1126254 [Chytriomyces sp. MP71]|nr:hypothetical protein BC830DRAFT_1126254 [Chytriomyces sp. MP71]
MKGQKSEGVSDSAPFPKKEQHFQKPQPKSANHPTVMSAATTSSRSREKALKKLETLLAVPENTICSDCSDHKPKWASPSLGVFLCNRCAQLHKKLSSTLSNPKCVKTDTTWTPEEVDQLGAMGNRRANAIYLGMSDAKAPPTPTSWSEQEMYEYIRNKYKKRTWMREKDKKELDAKATLASASSSSSSPSPAEVKPEDYKTYAAQIKQLEGMGFKDPRRNIIALKKAKGNLDAAVAVLVKMPEEPTPKPPTAPVRTQSSHERAVSATSATSSSGEDVKKKLRDACDFLKGMGFANELETLQALKTANGDLDTAVGLLVQLQETKQATSSTAVSATDSRMQANAVDVGTIQMSGMSLNSGVQQFGEFSRQGVNQQQQEQSSQALLQNQQQQQVWAQPMHQEFQAQLPIQQTPQFFANQLGSQQTQQSLGHPFQQNALQFQTQQPFYQPQDPQSQSLIFNLPQASNQLLAQNAFQQQESFSPQSHPIHQSYQQTVNQTFGSQQQQQTHGNQSQQDGTPRSFAQHQSENQPQSAVYNPFCAPSNSVQTHTANAFAGQPSQMWTNQTQQGFHAFPPQATVHPMGVQSALFNSTTSQSQQISLPTAQGKPFDPFDMFDSKVSQMQANPATSDSAINNINPFGSQPATSSQTPYHQMNSFASTSSQQQSAFPQNQQTPAVNTFQQTQPYQNSFSSTPLQLQKPQMEKQLSNKDNIMSLFNQPNPMQNTMQPGMGATYQNQQAIYATYSASPMAVSFYEQVFLTKFELFLT